MDHADVLVALGGAFLAAGLIARAGARIGLPTIPLFIVAGIVFGPHTPGVSLFAEDAESLSVLASLGLVFLLFYLGLEFSLDQLAEGGRKLALAGGGYIAINVAGGLAFGLALGWGVKEALVMAGIIGVSSSAIVTKILVELRRMDAPESRVILGIVVVEDIFLAFYLALLQPVLGQASGAGEAIADIAVAFAFLLSLAAAARWATKPIGRLVATRDDELLVVIFSGLALLVAGIGEELGVSDAIGAFMVGLLLGATPARERITHFVHPLRDAFGALFFFAFGAAISVGDVLDVAGPVVVALVLTLGLNVAAGILAGRVHGFDRMQTARIGFTVLARGEFALVLVTLAAASGLDPRLAPFVAGYVLVLACVGPLLAGRADALARWSARRPAGAPA